MSVLRCVRSQAANVLHPSAFAAAPSTPPFARPKKWPGPDARAPTSVQSIYNNQWLCFCFRTDAIAAPQRSNNLAGWEEASGVPPSERSVVCDERVEVFIWAPRDSHYFAFEVNAAGNALTCKARQPRQLDFSWSGSLRALTTPELPPRSPGDGAVVQGERFVVVGLAWESLGGRDALVDGDGRLRCGLYRAERKWEAKEGASEEATWGDFIWSSWSDPGDDVVDFHRPHTCGWLQLDQ